MKQLGQLEAEVMELLWKSESRLSVHDVRDNLTRPLAYTTVMTVLDNLHTKNLVGREKQGRAFVYSPTRSHEEHTAELLGNVLEGSNDRGAALMHFVGQLTPDEVAQLQAAVTQADPVGRSTDPRDGSA
ncbi:BlaI/MecI/CopY family transcriptional regulator [Nocardioides sp. ChNu-153]|uniref:BlaI/MecI/CopY family transcriptional regulator n=1 Tax=unclassified Nocardioides TaxID=2615069 RepID=UPI002404FDCC|nr:MULTISPECIES: BlaI/MecI/CopY family transcriptional regulator [unclassified Nocardioides]MDF9714859.1 BlaI/MecI/CopY family transcriptional regulator [Nocardioides sp. ChNu-99]MDN7120015.1 BlaI/MecI/CopY family transcriptional regulator [Nocardioides sp. ChNu-153]